MPRLTLCPRLSAAAVAVIVSACAGGSSLRQGAPVDEIATPPRLVNGEDVQAAIAAEYPPQLRDAGVGGVVRLRLLVGRDGTPLEMRLLESSGQPALDQAARRVARILLFSPATNHDGEPVEVWASFPIAFQGT